MGIKKYIIASIIYTILISSGVFFYEDGVYTLDILGTYFSLPVAVWFAIPLGLLAILSLCHIIFYSFKNYIHRNEHQKDMKKLFRCLEHIILGKVAKEVFHNKEYYKIVQFLQKHPLQIDATIGYVSGVASIDDALEMRKKIQNGEFVDKAMKLLGEDKQNNLYVQNLMNKFQFDRKFYVEVLKHRDNYNEEIVKMAFLRAIDNEDDKLIHPLIDQITISRDMLFAIYKKYGQFQSFKEEDYRFVLKKANLSSEDFITLAKLIKETKTPDDLIKIFDDICKNFELATKAYLYILLDLEMIEMAKEVLHTVDENDKEYHKFKLYLALKNSGEQCSIADFF